MASKRAKDNPIEGSTDLGSKDMQVNGGTKLGQICIEKGYTKEFKDQEFKIFNEELKSIAERRNIVKGNETGATDQSNKKSINGQQNRKPSVDLDLLGLALSGGGIRSATFNLGFLQALCRLGLLKYVDYLSTVSGGGYIGGCMTTLLNSTIENSGKNEKDLLDEKYFPFSFRNEDSNKDDQEAGSGSNQKRRFKPGKEKLPVKHLRYYSNYLTAEGNFLEKYISPVVAMARGVLLNFVLILPYILMVGIMLSIYFWIQPSTRGHYFFNLSSLEETLNRRQAAEDQLKNYVLRDTRELGNLAYEDRLRILHSIDPQIERMQKKSNAIQSELKKHFRSVWLFPLAMFIFITIGLNLVLSLFFKKTIDKRFKLSKFICSVLLIFSIAPFVANIFGLALAYWNFWNITSSIGLVSILTLIAPELWKHSQTWANQKKSAIVKIATSILIFSLAPLFLVFCAGIVVTHFSDFYLFIFSLLITTLLLGNMININKISLHGFYRDRLSRAYLIQRDASDGNDVQFDCIQPKDDLKLSSLKDDFPYHIINTNLNLTKKPPLHKGQKNSSINYSEGEFRNGDSFIFTRNWCGSEKTGYRKTVLYEQNDDHLDLGTAMAISGAAVNVGMAQSNLPILRPLLALLNIRLGYWALNPKEEPIKKLMRLLEMPLKNLRKSPGSWTILKEMVGQYSLDNKFVNLSDGGHFDNIGVYELLRRRCKYIIVSDAEADPEMQFQALSYIIRLARIDFGIEIEIDVADIRIDRESGYSRSYCAVGIVHYPAIDDMRSETGYLLYCKSSLTGNEPLHLHQYRSGNPDFPHQATADQWFDERQFEAYRELGYQIGKHVFKPATCEPIGDNLVSNFIKLKEFCHPHCPLVEKFFTKHTKALNEIINQVKNDQDLAFMDAQMFPGWDELMSEAKDKPAKELWLPEASLAIRKGFYICTMMIKLMEDVYLDLNLEKNHQHPDNRGWMNLFRYWSWEGIFRVTWAITACSFGSRFQIFCQEKLDIAIGDVEIKEIILEAQHVIDSADLSAKDLKTYLNEYEILMVNKLITIKPVRAAARLFSFHLVVKNPLNASQKKNFGFGFALMIDNKIAFLKVQDQYRNMGLGRAAITKMLSKCHFQKSDIDYDLLKRCKDIKPAANLDQIDMELMKTDTNLFEKLLNSAVIQHKS